MTDTVETEPTAKQSRMPLKHGTGGRTMTNDEAIYVLKNTAWLGSEEQAKKVEEAVKMAVEALKQPEIMSDGTLHIIVDADVSTIDRILMSQKGTHSGDIYYREEEHED